MTQTERELQRCPNCGAEWQPMPSSRAPDASKMPELCCPVCHYRFHALGAADAATLFDSRGFAEQLSILIGQARTEGLSADTITTALRDELAYNAELSNPTHIFHVQIVDLGPASDEPRMMAPGEIRAVLQRRRT